jgi:magnesium transporter
VRRFIKKRSQKAGLPPGTLIHIGEPGSGEVRTTVVEYDEGHFQERGWDTPEGCYVFPPRPAVTWINVDGIHQKDLVEKLGECFRLHPLVQEDILNTDQRPKVEDYGEDLFIVVKSLSYDEGTEEITAEQISLILRPEGVLSFQEKVGDAFSGVKERLRNGKGRLRRMGPDALVYALLDLVVDHYFAVLEKLGERIESLEANLLTDPSSLTLHRLQDLKREMLLLRKWVWPMREVLGSLERGDFSVIQESTRIYLRDVYDHTIQVMDTIEILRDMLSGMVEIYLSSINNRLNGVMKVLTIIATIFMPLTFLSGLYGMNFKYMPELEWYWGYPFVLSLMALIAGGMLVIFWRKKWF